MSIVRKCLPLRRSSSNSWTQHKHNCEKENNAYSK